MTVCIGGICADMTGDPRIILCSDHRLEDSKSGSDACVKLDHAGMGLMAMISGEDYFLGREHVEVIRKHFSSELTVTASSLGEELRNCAFKLKHRMADEYMQTHFAIDYNSFLEHGAEQFPPEICSRQFEHIENMDLSCDIIVAGFLDGLPHMYTITREGRVRQADPFGCVGSGASVALAALRQRKFQRNMDVREAMYYVWEAKALSEIAPGVGTGTTMVVMGPGKDAQSSRLYPVHVGGQAALQGHYKRCGLQPFVPFLEPFAEFVYPHKLLQEEGNTSDARQP